MFGIGLGALNEILKGQLWFDFETCSPFTRTSSINNTLQLHSAMQSEWSCRREVMLKMKDAPYLIGKFDLPHLLIYRADTWSSVCSEGNTFPIHSPQHSRIPKITWQVG